MQERTSVLVQATPPTTVRPRLPGGFGPFCQASSTWMGGEKTGRPPFTYRSQSAWVQCPALSLTSCATMAKLLSHASCFLSVNGDDGDDDDESDDDDGNNTTPYLTELCGLMTP